MKTSRTLALLVAAVVFALGLSACASKEASTEEGTQVQVQGQYDISAGTTKS